MIENLQRDLKIKEQTRFHVNHPKKQLSTHFLFPADGKSGDRAKKRRNKGNKEFSIETRDVVPRRLWTNSRQTEVKLVSLCKIE